uniref:TRUD domain-containing protein n=1 Tax=Ascaris lumbricoides TaxID=6252 RepID=A0A0M3IK14_ASCLU
MEKDFFVTEYIGDSCSEIKCILKQRYSDFIVNEITPQEVVTEISVDKECINAEKKTTEVACTINADVELPDGVSEQLVQEIDAILSDATKVVNIPAEGMDKLGRTHIHEWIRKRYQGKLNSQTRDSSIIVSTRKNDNIKRKIWPEGRPDYLHFTMSKENKDSHYALSLMAKFLGIKASNFGICGTKDRRGVTSQRVSVYRIDADRVRALNSKLRGIRLSHFEYCAKPCALGQLWGNQFRIILRCINDCEDAELCARVEDFKSNGFINYFGMQRFGSCGVATAEVGHTIIKRQYEEAVRTILKQRPALASNFGICGTKDRRGVTSQRVSVYRIDADRVRALNSKLRGIRLSHFEYCAKPCALGQLWGNQFRIILRCINDCEDAELCARVEDFKSNGFINYFGMQRFGSCGVATAEVGHTIIKRQYEEA